MLLIGIVWLYVRLTKPDDLAEKARENVEDEDDGGDVPDWKELITSRAGWARVGHRYAMEWKMVWKDVTFGFTVAGIIAAFVPSSFFQTLFVGAGSDSLSFLDVLLQTLVGPLAAFFTFIGSMGNIPLAALLFDHGVSFAGVMAFIFSDLVVFPVLRINAKYYGWTMALYILGGLLVALVGSALLLHYGFALAGLLPETASQSGSVTDQAFFTVDYKLFLNLAFLALSGVLLWLWRSTDTEMTGGEMADKGLDRARPLLARARLVRLARRRPRRAPRHRRGELSGTYLLASPSPSRPMEPTLADARPHFSAAEAERIARDRFGLAADRLPSPERPRPELPAPAGGRARRRAQDREYVRGPGACWTCRRR